MSEIVTTPISTPAGEMLAADHGGRLCLLDWRLDGRAERNLRRLEKRLGARAWEGSTPLLGGLARQLDEYFAGARKALEIPFETHGTEFQQRVWRALPTIPRGQTVSYRRLAAMTGNERAARAVAAANAANVLSMIIPCHRVISADGSPGGYAGGMNAKRLLLRLEGVRIR